MINKTGRNRAANSGRARIVLLLLLFTAARTVCIADSCFVGDKLVFSNFMGKVLTCFDTKNDIVNWKTVLENTIHSIDSLSDREILVSCGGKYFLIDQRDGAVIGKLAIAPGYVVIGHDSDGNVFLDDFRNHRTIQCYSTRTDRVVWSSDVTDPQSGIEVKKAGDFLFIFHRPTQYSINSTGYGKSSVTIIRGKNEIICMKCMDGSVLWRAPIKGMDIKNNEQALAGDKFIVCSKDSMILLVDRESGKIVSQYENQLMINNIAFWGADRLVLADGDGFSPQHLSILSLDDLKIRSQALLSSPEDARWSDMEFHSFRVFGDNLLVTQYSGVYSIDLNGINIKWGIPERLTPMVHDGVVYTMDQDLQFQRLATIDPQTGSKTLIYSERLPAKKPMFDSKSTTATASLKPPPSKKLSGKCPYGHAAVWEVPIIYGLLMPSPELEQAEQNMEYVWGGCSPMDEKIQTVCRQCRAVFDSARDVWALSVIDSSRQSTMITPLMSEFPIGPASLILGVCAYEEETRGGSLFRPQSRWLNQKLTYVSRMKRDDIKAVILDYLAENRVRHNGFRSTSNYRAPRLPDVNVASVPVITLSKNPVTEVLAGEWTGIPLTITIKPYGYEGSTLEVELVRERVPMPEPGLVDRIKSALE